MVEGIAEGLEGMGKSGLERRGATVGRFIRASKDSGMLLVGSNVPGLGLKRVTSSCVISSLSPSS